MNCAAVVETLLEAELFGIEERTATGVRGRRGKFEHADAGTLFLDEVSDLALSVQAKLLRAIRDAALQRGPSLSPPQEGRSQVSRPGIEAMMGRCASRGATFLWRSPTLAYWS